jgi:Uma2 family endonuclease
LPQVGISVRLAEIVARHGPMVMGVAMRMLPNRHDAEDAFQAAFLALAGTADRLRRREAVGAWLRLTAIRAARSSGGVRFPCSADLLYWRHRIQFPADFEPSDRMSTAALTTYTADDLLRMPDGGRYELVDGQLLEIDMGALSSWVGGQIYRRLDEYADAGKNGWAFPADAGIQCFPREPERVRRPDAFFVRRGRLPGEQIPDSFVQLAPDVVAEVVSPNDNYYAVDQKVWEYLEAGVKLVWVINPRKQTVMAYRGPTGDASLMRADDELSGEEVLPGFQCRVAALFPQSELRPSA